MSTNGSTDITDIPTYHEKVAITAIIVILGICSTVANSITILAIATKKYMHHQSNIFILSLAISDLVSGLIASPLWVNLRIWEFNAWTWGTFPCKLFWFIDESTSYCTSLHIASFSAWRYWMIKCPHKAPSIRKRHVIAYVSVLWVISFIFGGFVYSSFFDVQKRENEMRSWPSCSVNIHKIAQAGKYYIFSSLTFLLTPMILVIVMSVLISKELYFNKRIKIPSTKAKERNAVLQVTMISILFMIGYVPIFIRKMFAIEGIEDERINYWSAVGVYLCLRFSECMNPVAYNVASTKMRKASVEVLMKIWFRVIKCKNISDESSGVRNPSHQCRFSASTSFTRRRSY